MSDDRLRISDVLIDNLFWFIGCVFYSAGVILFAVPNNIAQSGMTGVAVILNYLFGVPVGIAGFCLNVPLFAFAWIIIGRKFTVKTLWVTAMLSAVMDGMTFLAGRGLIQPYRSGDKLLASIFCGILCGFGLSLVFLRNATTGGTDIIVRLVRRKLPHFSTGRVILILDAAVVTVSAAVFGSVESALYAAVFIVINSAVVDRVLYGAGSGKILLVFTEKGRGMAEYITSNIRRGVSVFPVEGGYTGESKNMLMIVLRSGEVEKVRKLIKRFDPDTFIVITEAKEVLGEGFRTPPADFQS